MQSDNEVPFVKVCREADLNEGAGKKFVINEVEVALFKVKGKIYALSNICTHQHTSVIHAGFIEGDFIVCPSHGWKFLLANGKLDGSRRGLDSFRVEIKEGDVYVQAFERKFSF